MPQMPKHLNRINESRATWLGFFAWVRGDAAVLGRCPKPRADAAMVGRCPKPHAYAAGGAFEKARETFKLTIWVLPEGV